MNYFFNNHVTTEKSFSLSDWFTGHHSAQYKVPVPEGADPNAFSDHVSTSIGEKPAPFSPLNKPTETPTQTKTIGQPSFVSKASSQAKDDHVVDVEAHPEHVLGGKNGTSAGITYHTTPQQDKDGKWFVLTEKDSYGDSKHGSLNPFRHFVGSQVLDRHMSNTINNAYLNFGQDKEKSETK